MKKLLLFAIAIFSFAMLRAQSPFSFEWGRDGRKTVAASCSSMYDMRPFENKVGITVYGSDYRKALDTKRWGQGLIFGGALAVSVGCPLMEKNGMSQEVEIANAVLGAAAIAAGIPMWIIGQKKLDKFIDDYSRRYAPGPRVSVGATDSGLGLALNF